MAEDEPTKQAKRKLREPETLRERSEKAQAEAIKPARQSVVKSSARKVSRPFKAAGGLFAYQPFKLIGKILRFVGLVIFPRYFRNSWRELRLVSWPSRRESRDLTFAVLIFAVVFGALITLVDYGLDKVFKHVLIK
ncbi:MAG TPA: preprotein translocase subunit SecE [Candidatus Saccharimonadales bacterium]|nr:preprotein translocase subunit SecE [Candidatus Saccharimonadales bacterium]